MHHLSDNTPAGFFMVSACAPAADETAAFEESEISEEAERKDSRAASGPSDAEEISMNGIIGEHEYRNSYQDRATGITLYWQHDQTNRYIGLKSVMKAGHP